MNFQLFLTLLTFLLSQLFAFTFSCTAIAFTPGSTVSGSSFLAHTDDSGGDPSDVRLVPVPQINIPNVISQTHGGKGLQGAKRPVYQFNSGYPRVVTDDRGPHYEPINEEQEMTKPLGFVEDISPLEVVDEDGRIGIMNDGGEREELGNVMLRPARFQVYRKLRSENRREGFRYGYFDQDYGMVNSVHLGIAESTCSAKTVGWAKSVPYGYNLFGIAELSKIALERCVTARCAVSLMGSLAEEYGFYSEDSGDPRNPGYADSAEALMLSDRTGEVWVFNILTGENNSSAIWAAQRVPNGHVAVIANGFSIREIDFDDKNHTNFLWSKNIVSVAKRLQFYDDSDKSFDFTDIFGFIEKEKEKRALTALYIGRRVWRVFDFVAPSLKLDPKLGYPFYPFSVAPDRQLAFKDMLFLLQDHYEGTQFDLSTGIKAGPFGNPNLFQVDRSTSKIASSVGAFERPISIFRSMFSFVVENNVQGNKCTLWYGQDKPHGTVYVPFLCGQEHIPKSFLKGKQSQFDTYSAWRAFNFLNNYAMLRFDSIMKFVKPVQRSLQDKALALVDNLVSSCLPDVKASHEKVLNQFAQDVVDQWWDLVWAVVGRFSDGYEIVGERDGQMKALSYPDWWLDVTGFTKWPGDTYKPPVVEN